MGGDEARNIAVGTAGGTSVKARECILLEILRDSMAGVVAVARAG